tara:strand:- start:83 stop:1726 length:1644 start_codon:yes stop_codon:yes gene_type:complete
MTNGVAFRMVMRSEKPIAFWRNDAMEQFIKKHGKDITGVLSGWDRIRFRGTIRMLAYATGMLGWLGDQRVLLKNFDSFAMRLTHSLRASVLNVAQAAGRQVRYLASSRLSKEDLVQELIRREGLTDGLVCVLSCVDPCQSYEIHRNPETKRIEPTTALRKCLHFYLYFIDPVIGLCHVRIQSWLPFTVHVCVNGREWLCRQLQEAGIRFTRSDNCLLDVADVPAAQSLLDAQPRADWTGMLNGLLKRSCPALLELPLAKRFQEYYWSADETEWATDIMFRSPRTLADLYPSLIKHAMTTFSSRDVMRFLGRTRMPARGGVDVRFNGQVVSELKERPEGVRIKHSVNNNSLKMYDKQGSVLRAETTINDAHDLSVYRATESDPDQKKKWRRLRKGVVDLPRRSEISQAANSRYLAALSEADATTPLGKVADAVRRPVVREGRRFRGLNPLSGPDADLGEILLRGEFSISGFRNRHVRILMHPRTRSREAQRRESSQISRLLRLFREHGLIRKLKGTHRYLLTAKGRRTLPAFIAARNASTEKLNKLAA